MKENLRTNRIIAQAYSVEDIINGDEISIDYIKICRRRYKTIRFNYQISRNDWEVLENELKQRENKVLGLNFSISGIDNYFSEFLELMRKDRLYWYFQFINFGTCKLDSQKLIKLTNFLISSYSDIERSIPSSMFRYLLWWGRIKNLIKYYR